MKWCRACGAIFFKSKECPICKYLLINPLIHQSIYEDKMRAILTPDDLKRGELIDPPGWVPMEIVRYHEEPADTDKSTNCIFTFKVIDGPNKGRQANKLFNEKALGFGKALWKALGFPQAPEGGYELSTELFEQAVGAKLKCYVKRGKSNKGNEFNDINDFMPLQ